MFRKKNPQYKAELEAVTAGYTHYAKGQYQEEKRPINFWLCFTTVVVILCCSVNDCNADRKLRRHKKTKPLTVSTLFCAAVELALLDPYGCDTLSRFIQSAFGKQSHKTNKVETLNEDQDDR